jgi:hypothetical protein
VVWWFSDSSDLILQK